MHGETMKNLTKRFKVLTEWTTKTPAFQAVVPCSLVAGIPVFQRNLLLPSSGQ